MVGREVLLRVEKRPGEPKEPLLRIEGLTVEDDRGFEKVRGVSFEVRGGEIVGLAGVDGNGQTELIDAIAGLRKVKAGRVVVGDEDVTDDGCRDCLDAGLGHIPEDRQRRGLVLDFSLAENIALHDYDHQPASRFGWLFPKRLVERARGLLKEFDVRGGGPQTLAGGLSGGNQQKVVLAREIDRNPKVLIAAQPTRGLDVGAIEFVHRRLVEERDEGRAVLLVSLELEEILSLSDRILVIYEGADRGRVRSGRHRGRAGHRDDRRGQEGGRVSGPDPSPLGPAPDLRKEPPQSGDSESFATRLAIAQKAGGLVVPLMTTVLAFLIGGLVVLATTGKNPLNTYKAIFEGAGFNWFFEVGSYELRIPFTDAHIWFPWNMNDFESLAAVNLQQTLIVWVPLVFTGLAVAFAFRCGMFNIGGQGQYLVGSIMARLGRLVAAPAAGLPAHRRSRSSPAGSPARSGRASPVCSRRPSAPTR